MKSIEVKDRQTLRDVACQHTGSPLGMLEIAKINDFDLDVELTQGMEILIPDEAENQEMLDYVNRENLTIVTGLNTDQTLF